MPKVKITGMPTVRIVDLPKALLGLEVTTTTMNPVETDKPRDINNCIIGEEIYDLASGVCQPIEGGYDPTQDEQKNQPAIGKTGPGTGVNLNETQVTTTTTGDCGIGYYKNRDGKCVPNKKGIEFVNDIVQAGLATGNAVARVFENKEADQAAQASMTRKSWNSTVKPGGNLGKTQLNEGIDFANRMARPNDGQYFGNYFGRTVGEFGGSFPSTQSTGPIKIKIIGEPDTEAMKYGGQSGYGFDSGWKRSYTEMNKISSDYYKNSMSEDKSSDEEPVLEAEGGETIYKPGDQAFFRLNGPKHSQGGIELTGSQVNSKTKDVPSFIYSDTPSLKIKDKNVLDYFGIAYKKGGVTPADISKKYDLNKFKAIVQDPNSDELAKSTAQLMIDKNEKRLAELAIIQEKMKGLKAPKFAEQTLREGSAAFGGFVPTYAEGGVTDTTTIPPVQSIYSNTYNEFKNRLLAKENEPLRKTIFEKYKTKHPKTNISQDDYINNLLKFQEQIYSLQDKYKNDPKKLEESDWNKPDNRRYNQEMKSLGYTPLNKDEIKMFQSGFRNLEDAMYDPVFFQTFGKYFKTNPIGLKRKSGKHVYKGKPISEDDAIVGPTTNRQFLQLAEEIKKEIPVSTTTTAFPFTEPPRYLCINGIVKSLPPGIAGGYLSSEEAGKNCGKVPKKYPFDYLLPDKLNMLAHAAIFPRQIFPFNPDLAFNPKPLALEDWRAKAAQRFSTQYAAPSAQLAQFGPTQGLGANLSFLAGQTGQQMAAEDIAPTISRNIDRVNAYTASEGQRQDSIDAYNNMQKEKRWAGYATTKQNYDNAMRQYLKENSDAFTRAWKNRMHLGDINDTNPNFYKDATTGRQTWKGNAFYTGTGSSGDSGNLGKMYSLYYQNNMEVMKSDIPDEAERKKAAREMAMEQIRADRYSETTDPNSNKTRRRSSGFDFNPTS